MSAFNYLELKNHLGHDIVCVEYANGVNVAIECETCNEVLLDYDKQDCVEDYLLKKHDEIVARVEEEDYIVFKGASIKNELINEFSHLNDGITTLEEYSMPVVLDDLEDDAEYIVDGDFSFKPIPLYDSCYLFLDFNDYLSIEEYESFSQAYGKITSQGVNIEAPFIEISIRGKEYYIN